MKNTCPNDIFTCPQKNKSIYFVLEVVCPQYTFGFTRLRQLLFLGPSKECTTFAPATIAPRVNANVKHNPTPNPIPNPNPNLNPYPTLNWSKTQSLPHFNSLLLEISSQEQLSPEQMSDHLFKMLAQI